MEEFSGGAEQFDDITMIALRFSPPVPADETANQRFSLVLAADTNNVDELSAFIVENLEKAGCPEKIREQIELAAEEVFVNIARYAYKDYAGQGECDADNSISWGSCEITLTIGSVNDKNAGGTVMILTFTDCGIPFNPLEHTEPDINSPLEEREKGGFGLLIVKRVMDMVEYRYNGMNRLLLKKCW